MFFQIIFLITKTVGVYSETKTVDLNNWCAHPISGVAITEKPFTVRLNINIFNYKCINKKKVLLPGRPSGE